MVTKRSVTGERALKAGQTTQLEYDNGGRLARRVCGAGDERFMYDGSGRLIDAQNAISRVQHFFDPVGNLVREHHAQQLFDERRSYVWRHEYNETGTRIKTVRPDGHALDWLVYGTGHVHGMQLDGQELIQFERDELHRETQRTLSNRIAQNTRYDPLGRMESQALRRSGAPSPIVARRYQYDAAGQLREIDDSRQGVTRYQYDPVGRLIEAVSPLATERFAFDPAGNIIDPGSPAQARSGDPRQPGARTGTGINCSNVCFRTNRWAAQGRTDPFPGNLRRTSKKTSRNYSAVAAQTTLRRSNGRGIAHAPGPPHRVRKIEIAVVNRRAWSSSDAAAAADCSTSAAFCCVT
ncbi:hypothetical protein D1Y85_23060 [Paraburkholderia dinghuensis]|uniref:RHS repeat protein n=1 Tax=Paraburkholderia dinghuensis TaxID=2305225 RepID=A0A3N6PK96_9BURK|nr:hypothetical protein D1Y85_23060 [Paraburkholderia dinghuensis]